MPNIKSAKKRVLVSEKKAVSELSQKQIETIKRIQGEPESIMLKED